jgi:fatty-acid peroxygenase
MTPTTDLPRDPAVDSTAALLREGYKFMPDRFDRLATDGFRARLMLHEALCLRGPEAVALVYGSGFTRKGALPPTVLRLLQDKGSVQQMEGTAHAHRKALFLTLCMGPARVGPLVDALRGAWLAALPGWQAQGRVTLIHAVSGVLTRAACHWMGLPLARETADRLADDLLHMVDRAAGIGPPTLSALLRRRRVERWLGTCVTRTRAGALIPPKESALTAVAAWEEDGRRLPAAIAAVELLNILRPVVAVARYAAFAALTLHRHPDWLQAFRTGDDSLLTDFCEEVRRMSPFFPLVGAIATRGHHWRGMEIRRGQWVLVDLYGTTHDARIFPDPDAFRPERMLSWDRQDDSFVPQGGGRVAVSHRCPGEEITVALMAESVRLLARAMDWGVPDQDLSVDLSRMPAQPADGMVLDRIRPRPGFAGAGFGTPAADMGS